jgi:23S rRNA (pseudouridine1915-N3)-methyltransferase
MKLIVLAAGKMRSKPLRELCEDYLARLSRYGPAEMKEIKAADSGSAVQMAELESERLLGAIEPPDQVFVLDERGSQMSSIELSNTLKTHEMRSTKRLVFVIGGAFGMTDALRKRGKLLALSKMTLPHELCRTLLFEQLYRARTIQNGEPYHHA